MRRCKCFLLYLALMLASGTLLHAQSKKDLEKKKAQIHKDIEYTNNLLNETKNKKKGSLNELVILNKKIVIHEELIGTIHDELGILDGQIDETNSIIGSMEKDHKKLKEEYAMMIRFAYKNKGAYDRLMFLFASKDFNQAYKRIKYLQQYSEYRKKQVNLIVKAQLRLNDKRLELEGKRTSKKTLLTSQEHEKVALKSEKNEQVVLFNNLQDQEKQLKSELKEKLKAEARLNKAIEDIIKREIEKARVAAEKKGQKNVTSANVFTSSPESQKVSDDFSANKGRLPWPVEQGVITGTFGDHPHPVLKGIRVKNNGIDINSNKGALARAIFDGMVTGVVVIPGSYKAVIIRHGQYLSVYSNLEQVYVRMGDKVNMKQSIGAVHTDDESKTEVHLEIWKGTDKLDPSNWLFMKK
jgi:septal ring factor EnvC (AmiA/AmiB activator)